MNLIKTLLLAATLSTGTLALADAESTKEVEQLLNTIGMQATLEKSMSQMVAAQLQQNPGLEPYKASLTEFLQKYMSYESLKPEMIKLYSEAFTTTELKEINAFYATEAGKKAAEKMPELMMEIGQYGVTRIQANMGELQTMMKTEAERQQALKDQLLQQESADAPLIPK